jgi:Protease inhibitor Inh
MVRLPVLAALLTLSSAAFGQGLDPGILQALKGPWLLATDDGKPGCRMTLETAQTIGGYALTLAPDCARNLPRIADASAWSPHGGMNFSDPTRRRLFKLEEDETGIYRSPAGETGPVHVLFRPNAGVDRLPTASAVFGEWVMRRPGGEVVCQVRFLDKPPPGGQESYSLSLAPGCQQVVAKLKLATWRIETTDLLLYSPDGESLAFVPTATGFAKAAREGGRPLVLERQAR